MGSKPLRSPHVTNLKIFYWSWLIELTSISLKKVESSTFSRASSLW